MKKFFCILFVFLSITSDVSSCDFCKKDIKVPDGIYSDIWLDGSFINNNFVFRDFDNDKDNIQFGLLHGISYLGLVNHIYNVNESILSDGSHLYVFLSNKIVKINPFQNKILWSKEKLTGSSRLFLNNYFISDDSIYVSSYNGNMYKIDANNGFTSWYSSTNLPIKSLSNIKSKNDGKDFMYVLSSNDVLSKISAENGLLIDESEYSSSNPSNISDLGISNLLFYKNNLIIPYSNGQIISLDADKNSIIWSNLDFSKNEKNYKKVFQLNDINQPIFLIEDKIYVFSKNSRKMGIINAENGKADKLVDLEVGSTNILNVGDLFFVLDINDNLKAINKNGDIIWNVDLLSFVKSKVSGTSYFNHRKVKDSIIKNNLNFLTPIMLNKKLLLFSNSGFIIILDSLTGNFIDYIETGYYFANKPMILNDTVYLLTSFGRIFYLR